MVIVGAALLDKADKADIIVEVASGGVGSDGQLLFIGFPEISVAGHDRARRDSENRFVERSKSERHR